MNGEPWRKDDPRRRPPQWLLVLIALGVAVVTSLLAGGMLFLMEAFRAKPMG